MKVSTNFFATSVAAVALFFSTAVQAQSSPRFGVGLNVGAPTAGKTYSMALAADLRYQFDIDKQLSVPLTTGYTQYFGKNNISDMGYVPLKAGLKYFFSETGSGAYGLAEAGAAFGTSSGAKTTLVYSPAIGYAWSNGLDLGAKLEGISRSNFNTGYIGLRLAYGFKL